MCVADRIFPRASLRGVSRLPRFRRKRHKANRAGSEQKRQSEADAILHADSVGTSSESASVFGLRESRLISGEIVPKRFFHCSAAGRFWITGVCAGQELIRSALPAA